MKKLLTICMMGIATFMFSQENNTTYTTEGDLVKATYYYEDGSIKTQGFFKNNKLTGKWVRFDKNGKKVQIAHYKDGKKVGKWLVWTSEGTLKEINYKDNSIASVNVWKSDAKIAINNK